MARVRPSLVVIEPRSVGIEMVDVQRCSARVRYLDHCRPCIWISRPANSDSTTATTIRAALSRCRGLLRRSMVRARTRTGGRGGSVPGARRGPGPVRPGPGPRPRPGGLAAGRPARSPPACARRPLAQPLLVRCPGAASPAARHARRAAGARRPARAARPVRAPGAAGRGGRPADLAAGPVPVPVAGHGVNPGTGSTFGSPAMWLGCR